MVTLEKIRIDLEKQLSVDKEINSVDVLAYTIEEALAEYCENGHPSVYIRRYDESITGANIFKLCTPHIDSMIVMSNGKWNNFEYKNRTFYIYEKKK